MSTLAVRNQRPIIVTLFMVGVLIFSMVLLAGGIKTLQLWRYPDQTLPVYPLVYVIIRNFLFGIGGLFLVWGLLSGKHWAPGWTLAVVVVYIATYWLEWFFLVSTDIRSENLAFSTCLTVFAVLITWLTLFIYPGSRHYFRREA